MYRVSLPPHPPLHRLLPLFLNLPFSLRPRHRTLLRPSTITPIRPLGPPLRPHQLRRRRPHGILPLPLPNRTTISLLRLVFPVDIGLFLDLRSGLEPRLWRKGTGACVPLFSGGLVEVRCRGVIVVDGFSGAFFGWLLGARDRCNGIEDEAGVADTFAFDGLHAGVHGDVEFFVGVAELERVVGGWVSGRPVGCFAHALDGVADGFLEEVVVLAIIFLFFVEGAARGEVPLFLGAGGLVAEVAELGSELGELAWPFF